MTDFLALSVPDSSLELESVFPEGFYLVDAHDTPIGEAALGGNTSGQVVLVNAPSCATDIISNRNSRSDEFCSAIRQLMSQAPTVSVLLHRSEGRILSEEIELCGKKKVAAEEFLEAFPIIQRDIRYALVSSA